jgi:hypothetical protein
MLRKTMRSASGETKENNREESVSVVKEAKAQVKE